METADQYSPYDVLLDDRKYIYLVFIPIFGTELTKPLENSWMIRAMGASYVNNI